MHRDPTEEATRTAASPRGDRSRAAASPRRDRSGTGAPLRRGARLAFAANAALAWGAVGLVLTLTLLDGYGTLDFEPEPGLYGAHAAGWPGALGRMVDAVSYFTMWSNVTVALAMAVVVAHPRRDAPWQWALRLSALLMITVTALVYALVLAPAITLRGWSLLTNPWQHIVVPAVTVLVWLVWGPHGRLTRRTVPAALVVPLAWIVVMLGRGALDGTYPYGFTNVAAHGYPAVLAAVGMVLAFGLALGCVFWVVDAALSRRAARRSAATR